MERILAPAVPQIFRISGQTERKRPENPRGTCRDSEEVWLGSRAGAGLYTPLDLDEALKAGVASGYLTSAEADTERKVLTYFRPRVERLVSESRPLDEFVREFARQQSNLAAFAEEAARFVGRSPSKPIPFYVIADPDDANNGRWLQRWEINAGDSAKGTYPTVLHELFHAFVETKKAEVDRGPLSSGAGLPDLE